jgi:hypothetical protein
MADVFDNEIRMDLEERGFTNAQIEILESFERDKYGLHSDIEKMMDDYNMTPDEIMSEYNNDDENPDEVPQQGGKRRSRRSRKNKKSKRSRKNKKTKRNRKSRRSRRR